METNNRYPRPYNGHPTYEDWNVALWVNNDPSLYCMAKRAVTHSRTLDQAAGFLCDDLARVKLTHTRDGVAFTRTNLRQAIRGMSYLRRPSLRRTK